MDFPLSSLRPTRAAARMLPRSGYVHALELYMECGGGCSCCCVWRLAREYMRSHNLLSTCFNSFKILQSYGFFASDFTHLIRVCLRRWVYFFSEAPRESQMKVEVCHIPAFLMWRRRREQQWHTFTFAPQTRLSNILKFNESRWQWQIAHSSSSRDGGGEKKVKPKFTHS